MRKSVGQRIPEKEIAKFQLSGLANRELSNTMLLPTEG